MARRKADGDANRGDGPGDALAVSVTPVAPQDRGKGHPEADRPPAADARENGAETQVVHRDPMGDALRDIGKIPKAATDWGPRPDPPAVPWHPEPTMGGKRQRHA